MPSCHLPPQPFVEAPVSCQGEDDEVPSELNRPGLRLLGLQNLDKLLVRPGQSRWKLDRERSHQGSVRLANLSPDDVERRIKYGPVTEHREQQKVTRAKPTDLRPEVSVLVGLKLDVDRRTLRDGTV